MGTIWEKTGAKNLPDEIFKLESLIGAELPEDFRNYLLQYNGGVPTPDTFNFEGGASSIQRLYSLGVEGAYGLYDNATAFLRLGDSTYLPIGIDPGGNAICLCYKGDRFGEIYWADHHAEKVNEGSLHLVANSFRKFLEGLRTNPYELETDPIERLASSGTVEDPQQYEARGGALDAQSRYERTILQEAARHGNTALVKACVARGLDRAGALHLAALNGNLEVVEWLLDEGDDVNARDERGLTALQHGFMHPDIQVLLLSRGAR